LTFRQRLFLAQAPLAAALVVVGVASLRTVSDLGKASEQILRENYRSALAAEEMLSELDRMERDGILRSIGVRLPATESVDARRDRFESELRVQTANITEPGEATATERLRSAWLGYRKTQDEALARAEGLETYLGPVRQAWLQVHDAAGTILALNHDAMVRKSALAQRTAHGLLQFMGMATLAALGLGLLASTALTARTARPLAALGEAVRRFGEGDLDARARPRGDDEIAVLGREFDVMAARLQEYRNSSLGQLLRAQQSAQAAIDSLPDPVLVVDTAGVVLTRNRAAVALLGPPPRDADGQALDTLKLDARLRERLRAVCAHVLGGGGPYAPRSLREAVRIEGCDGPRRLLPRAAALDSPDRGIAGVTVVLQDVTRFARFDELRNDLVATVAHEFRTPLTSLQMAVHMCGDEATGPLNEGQRALMAGARKDCDRLQTIVDEILDLSRIESGEVLLDARPIDARALLARAVADAKQIARAAGLEIELEASDHPLPVLADPERVKIVLSNLLGNAMRYSAGTARVAVGPTLEGRFVRFEVSDEGPGIPPQYRERVFDRFFRVPGAKGGGVGLGLHISREIVRAHGGQMGVQSELGRGSTFWFTLPASSR
jgi:two-component system, NtrC family, sensor histidine kinase KinB